MGWPYYFLQRTVGNTLATQVELGLLLVPEVLSTTGTGVLPVPIFVVEERGGDAEGRKAGQDINLATAHTQG